jgi:DNA-binding transcriptional ArsR family regulator
MTTARTTPTSIWFRIPIKPICLSYSHSHAIIVLTFRIVSKLCVRRLRMELLFRGAKDQPPLIRRSMDSNKDRPEEKDEKIHSGTTLHVYRYLYKQGRPLGVHEVQRALKMQAASSAHYHLRKLVEAGLVKEREGGYVVDRVLFENMIRVRGSLLPIQTTFSAFFATTLIFLLTILRPRQLYGVYVFALIIDLTALGIFSFQAIQAIRKIRTL